MAGRRVGGALLDIVARIARNDLPRLTLDSFREEVRRAGASSPWAPLEELITADVDDLTVSEYFDVIGAIRSFLTAEADRLADVPKQLICRYATTQNIVRTLTDRETLARMARMEPVRMPTELPSDLDRLGQLVRTGHSDASPHWELPVSSQLYGSKLASYFYVSGSDLPDKLEERPAYLVAHDSDELVVYFGYGDRSREAGVAYLPMYLDGRADPYEFVWCPVRVEANQFFISDGLNPHFWFAPKSTVAFFVNASPNQMFRKPVAFRSENRDSVPGGSYPLFETRSRRKPRRDARDPAARTTRRKTGLERISYLLGKRFRRKRDGFGLSANEIQNLKTRGRGISRNIIGKIENDAFGKLHLRLVADYAEALDVPLPELFPREPSEMKALPIQKMRRPNDPHDQDVGARRERPYAVTPHFFSLGSIADPAAMLLFREGEADIVLLPLEGAVEVYVAPDPLLLALELVHDFTHARGRSAGFTFDDPYLKISLATIERLKRRQLLWNDQVEERQAYHFNAALPHVVVAAPGTTATVIVVTTRSDIHVPDLWRANSSDGADRNTVKTS